MRKYAAKTDLTQPAIVAALRKAGAGVLITSRTGDGYCDLNVLFRGVVHFVECKNDDNSKRSRTLTPDQIKFKDICATHGVTVHVVRTIEEALKVIS